MNFVLCISRTAHTEEKKKGYTNPEVLTIIGTSAAKPHMDDTCGIFHICICVAAHCA